MEIITGVERRRRLWLEEKLRIVAEVEQPGASFADVARRHEVSRGLVWNWRRQVRRGEPAPDPMPTFVPVQIMAEPPIGLPPPSSSKDVAPADPSRIEITYPTGPACEWAATLACRLAPGDG